MVVPSYYLMIIIKGVIKLADTSQIITAAEYVGVLISNGVSVPKKVFNNGETHLTVGSFMEFSKNLCFWVGDRLYYTSKEAETTNKAKEEAKKAAIKAQLNDDTEDAEEEVTITPEHPTVILKAQEIANIKLVEDTDKGTYDYPRFTLVERSEDRSPITLLNLVSNCTANKIRVDGKTYSLSKSSRNYPSTTILYKTIDKINLYLTRDEEDHTIITSAVLNVTLKKDEPETTT